METTSNTIENRLAWTGMSPNELTRPGATLMLWLLQTANRRGHQMREMADHLGVTYGYIAQLRNGQRKIEHISQVFSEACALYLGVAPIVVKIAAGKISAHDFVLPTDSLGSRLESALNHIQRDPVWGCWLPANACLLDKEMQLFIVMSYEQATGLKLVGESGNLQQQMSDLMSAIIIHDEQIRNVTNNID